MQEKTWFVHMVLDMRTKVQAYWNWAQSIMQLCAIGGGKQEGCSDWFWHLGCIIYQLCQSSAVWRVISGADAASGSVE